jgi:hypothetical protein
MTTLNLSEGYKLTYKSLNYHHLHGGNTDYFIKCLHPEFISIVGASSTVCKSLTGFY